MLNNYYTYCSLNGINWLKKAFVAISLTIIVGASTISYGKEFVAAQAPFTVQVNGKTVYHTISFEPIMPGGEVVFTASDNITSRLSISINQTALSRQKTAFSWQAPTKPGVYSADITLAPETKKGHVKNITVQLIVMVPASKVKDGFLNGYQIGNYPAPLRGLPAYHAPQGFIEVNTINRDTKISPNFTLGNFLCKQSSGYPKYLVLQPALLTKLEELLTEVNSKGVKANSFVIMSGYRTPWYNKSINNAASSYHIYGGAADIYIDVNPKDGRMDDINKDGKRDRADAAYLYQITNSLFPRQNRPELTGGLGEYGSNSAHGPFIHVDVRGSRARWGHGN
jgi:hypothetical protein